MEQRFMHLGPSASARRPADRPGFSFTEILFAVMILGIGFIMVAAIFPVAIQQTALTGDETVAAAIAREGTNAMTSINNSALLPPTVSNPPSITAAPNQRVIGQVWSLHDDRMVNWTPFAPTAPTLQRDVTWNAISGNLILPMDRRYAWVGMYKRDGTWNNPATSISPDPFAQVILIGVQCRNRSAYVATLPTPSVGDLDRSPNVSPPAPATLEPMLMTASFEATDTSTGPPVMTFDTSAGDGRTGRLAPGAFVVVSDDNLINYSNATYHQYAGQFNGHIYRLGNFRADMSTSNQVSYEFAPGYDSFPDPGVSTTVTELKNAQVFVVGRGYTDPTNPKGGSSQFQFDGAAQDVAVYVTYIRVN